jgi:hypothetical protein
MVVATPRSVYTSPACVCAVSEFDQLGAGKTQAVSPHLTTRRAPKQTNVQNSSASGAFVVVCLVLKRFLLLNFETTSIGE